MHILSEILILLRLTFSKSNKNLKLSFAWKVLLCFQLTRTEWSGTQPEALQGVGVCGMHNKKKIKNYKKCQYHPSFFKQFIIDGRLFYMYRLFVHYLFIVG